MESPTEGTTDPTGITNSTNLENQKKTKDFVQKPGFTVRRSNSSLRTALPPPSLPLSSVSATAATIPSPIKSSSSSLPSSATSNIGQHRLSIAPSLARNSLISQYSPVIEHATEVTVSQPNSTSPDNNSVTLPPYRRASISEVSAFPPKSRPASAATDSMGVGRKPSIVVIENSRRSTVEMESVLSDMKALRKASLKGKKSKEQQLEPQLGESDQPKLSRRSSTPTSGALSSKPTSPVMTSKKLPAKAKGAIKSQQLSISPNKELPALPALADFKLNEAETTPPRTTRSGDHLSAATMTSTTVANLAPGPAKILSPVPGSAGSSHVNLPVEPSFLATQLSHKLPAGNDAETEKILPPEPPFAERANPDIANSSTETFLSAQSHQEASSDEHQAGPFVQSQPSAAVLQSQSAGISNVISATGKSSLTNLMIKARQQQKRLAARSVSSPLAGACFHPSSSSSTEPLDRQYAQQKFYTPNIVAAREEDYDSERFAHAHEDEAPATGTAEVEPLALPQTHSSGTGAREESKIFYESNTSNSPSSSDGEDIGIRRRVGRRARASSNPEGLLARQKRSSQRLNQLSRDPLIDSGAGNHHSSKSRSRHHHHHHNHHQPHHHHHHDDHPADKREPPSRRLPFETPSMQQLLELSHKTLKLRDLDLPPTERVLIEKFVDSLARLSVDIATDTKKRPEGIRRLHNALRAIEGWI